jgi:hypothetical protein
MATSLLHNSALNSRGERPTAKHIVRLRVTQFVKIDAV